MPQLRRALVASRCGQNETAIYDIYAMTALGIALIVVGLALVCAGTILAQTEESLAVEGEKTETDGLADLVQRLNEISDDEPIERYAGELRRRGDQT